MRKRTVIGRKRNSKTHDNRILTHNAKPLHKLHTERGAFYGIGRNTERSVDTVYLADAGLSKFWAKSFTNISHPQCLEEIEGDLEPVDESALPQAARDAVDALRRKRVE